MTFEFLIACRLADNDDLKSIISGVFTRVLQDNMADFDAAAAVEMIQLRLRRDGEIVEQEGVATKHAVVGMTILLPDEVESVEVIIDELAAALVESTSIFHVVKFEDPLLELQLRQFSTEIFAIEMKLRRVLSLVYLHAYQVGDPYNLLIDEKTQPMSREAPQIEQMRGASENQFFHLTFSQYISLNERADVRLPSLLAMLQASTSFDTFRNELTRIPIGYEDDASLLAGLKERMDAIEKMRNCVAHNRRPTNHIVQNYKTALPLLERLLDDYLAGWQL